MSRILGKVATAVAALSLASVPAAAAPASKLSLRAATTAENSSNLLGTPVIPAIALIAFAVGVIIVATDDDNPDSP
ncbi:MAG: hypothetical protein J7500_07660 [Sphingomonas sp.]|uniref:hypothetical protein n=1 Tax=Sphingomonas sp. TaxID=28214 RepID=UPI001B049D95|nr:hypothetical protein [Sphingomonas sp.]MBO9622572.1 hypothetical protein [Sphingomonas sp.]